MLKICQENSKLAHGAQTVNFSGITQIPGSLVLLYLLQMCQKTFIFLSCLTKSSKFTASIANFRLTWKGLSCHEVDFFHIFHIELFEDTDGTSVFETAFEGKVVDFLLGEVKTEFM